MDFVRSNVWMTGHSVRSFTLIKKTFNSELFVQLSKAGHYWRSSRKENKEYGYLSGQKRVVSEKN